jgi:hypothetical protein
MSVGEAQEDVAIFAGIQRLVRRLRSKVWRLQGSAPVTTGYMPPNEAAAVAEQQQRLSAVIIGPNELLRRKL